MAVPWRTKLKNVRVGKCVAVFEKTAAGKIILSIRPRDINDESAVKGKRDLRKLARAIIAEVGE